MWRMAQVRKPPVPQAGSKRVSPGAGVGHLDHECGDGAGRVVLARIAGRLQVVEDLLVDVAEVLALGQVVEVDAVDLVDHLPHQLAGFHVVVGVLEDVADHDLRREGHGPWSGRFFSAGNSLALMKARSSSPVIPSGSAAQLRH
jgi:hypothetical protein